MSQIPRFTSQVLDGIPRCSRGYSVDEFLNFRWASQIDPTKYRVLIEDLSGRWIELSKTLQPMVYIPNTHFDPHATLVVVGVNKNRQQVRYIGEMTRGDYYELPSDMAGDHTFRKFSAKYNL